MDFLTLSQLNTLVSEELKLAFPDTYWVMAETSDVRVNHSNGHCYLEFIEKNALTGSISAKAKAYIWNRTFALLKPYFEQTTGQAFVSGIKVLVCVSVDFHPLYGYGLNVCDIDPAYTLGDMQRKRQEIIRQLEEEGVFFLNKELELTPVPQRIAVITSPTAAGYEDFLDHLLNNKEGFVFYPYLFPAIMQGEQTEDSIIAALDKIYRYKDLFDAVVIIRGGGATSDLSSFDSYLLATNCAQFPLPVITGIGHERDDTIVDAVAYYRAKTPTAVADFFVEALEDTYSGLLELQNGIVSEAGRKLELRSEQLKQIAFYLPNQSRALIEKQKNTLELQISGLRNACVQYLSEEQSKLKIKESFLKFSSPEYILSKGYSITMKNGKSVKSAKELKPGDLIETRLSEGKIFSEVSDRS